MAYLPIEDHGLIGNMHTAALVGEILDTERHHARELGGKWTPA